MALTETFLPAEPAPTAPVLTVVPDAIAVIETPDDHETVHELAVQNPIPFPELDRSFLRMVAKGVAAGILVLTAIMIFVLKHAMPDMPGAALVGGAFFIGLWPGALGGVVAVGVWSEGHHGEVFGKSH